MEVKIFLIEATSDLCERNPEKWGEKKLEQIMFIPTLLIWW